MESWEMVAIAIAAVLLIAAIAFALLRLGRRREVRRLQDQSVELQERAADREAEAGSIRSEAKRDRRMAHEAAERARELQEEADARAERALAAEAEADVVRGEADQELERAREAQLEAEKAKQGR